MSDTDKREIERQALSILETLAEHPDDPAMIAQVLASVGPAVAERVMQITTMAARRDTMPTDLSAVQAIKAFLAPPERFGPYRLVEPVGRGGMGEVWRGERDDGLFEQVVAIKLIQSHLQVRAGEAFESERRILARFEHPGIARLIDGGTTDDGRACLVMEFVDGVPFDTGCAGLTVGARIGLFRQVLAAVAYAHGRLVAHGDLKPGNILVDGDARVRLLDFGIARLITDQASAFLLSGAVTSSFASPARLAGEPPSIADDIFALGRLLTIAIGSAADRELAAIARKAASDHEADRYATVPELLADIDRWSNGLPVMALPYRPLYVLRKFVRRQAVALAAAIVLMLALGYAGWTYELRARDRIEAAARFEDARSTARYLLFTLYDELAAHPDTLILRKQVAATAQTTLDRLAQSRSTTPAVRVEAARGLLRLADVQGSPGMASLGDIPGARRNIETALRLLAAEDSADARRTRFDALLDSAFLAQNGESDDGRAARDLAGAKVLLAAGQDPGPQPKARYFLAISSIDRQATHNDLALADADQAIAALGADTGFDTLKLRSKAFERKGDALYYMHRHAEAIAAYRAAVAPIERAVMLRPGAIEMHRRLAHIRWNLGTAVMDYGDPHEALALFSSARAEIGRVLAFDPHDDDARKRLAMYEQARGETLVILGRYDEGFAVMTVMKDRYRDAWLAHPGDARALRSYAVTLHNLADQQGKHGRLAQACVNWREHLRLYGLIEASGHLIPEDRETAIAPVEANVRAHCS